MTIKFSLSSLGNFFSKIVEVPILDYCASKEQIDPVMKTRWPFSSHAESMKTCDIKFNFWGTERKILPFPLGAPSKTGQTAKMFSDTWFAEKKKKNHSECSYMKNRMDIPTKNHLPKQFIWTFLHAQDYYVYTPFSETLFAFIK